MDRFSQSGPYEGESMTTCPVCGEWSHECLCKYDNFCPSCGNEPEFCVCEESVNKEVA